MWREKARGDVLALGLVLGGALGNILDRVRFGYVVDFAAIHIGEWRPFLIFNLADAAITIGVLIPLARALLMRDKGTTVEKRIAYICCGLRPLSHGSRPFRLWFGRGGT